MQRHDNTIVKSANTCNGYSSSELDMQRESQMQKTSTLASAIDFKMFVDVSDVRHDGLPVRSLHRQHFVHVLFTSQLHHSTLHCVQKSIHLHVFGIALLIFNSLSSYYRFIIYFENVINLLFTPFYC